MMVRLSCIHVTVGAGSPSISQVNLADSPSETVTDWGLVSILAGREGATLWTTLSPTEVDFTLASDVVRFADKENLSDE